MELSIKNLNKTLPKGLKLKIVTFDNFKNIHSNTSCSTLNGLIKRIDKVEKLTDGWKATLIDGSSLAVNYAGQFSKNGKKYKTSYYDGRSRVLFNSYNASLYPEKWIGICKAIYDNELPVSFDNITVNVMDGSGNIYTAHDLGIPYNIHEENLEWTTSARNSTHGNSIKKLFEYTGKVYRFSANDLHLYDALALKNIAWIKHYAMNNCIRIK